MRCFHDPGSPRFRAMCVALEILFRSRATVRGWAVVGSRGNGAGGRKAGVSFACRTASCPPPPLPPPRGNRSLRRPSALQVIVEGFEERGGILKLKEQRQQGTSRTRCALPASACNPARASTAPVRWGGGGCAPATSCRRSGADLPQVVRCAEEKIGYAPWVSHEHMSARADVSSAAPRRASCRGG